MAKKPRNKPFCNSTMPNEMLLTLVELTDTKTSCYSHVKTSHQEANKNTSIEIDRNRINWQLNQGNRKRFPLFKTGNCSFIDYTKLCAALKPGTKNYVSVSIRYINANWVYIKNKMNRNYYYYPKLV